MLGFEWTGMNTSNWLDSLGFGKKILTDQWNNENVSVLYTNIYKVNSIGPVVEP